MPESMNGRLQRAYASLDSLAASYRMSLIDRALQVGADFAPFIPAIYALGNSFHQPEPIIGLAEAAGGGLLAYLNYRRVARRTDRLTQYNTDLANRLNFITEQINVAKESNKPIPHSLLAVQHIVDAALTSGLLHHYFGDPKMTDQYIRHSIVRLTEAGMINTNEKEATLKFLYFRNDIP